MRAAGKNLVRTLFFSSSLTKSSGGGQMLEKILHAKQAGRRSDCAFSYSPMRRSSVGAGVEH